MDFRQKTLGSRIKFFIIILGLAIGQNAMSKTLKIFVGDEHHAPYDVKGDTSILGSTNPILFGYLLKANETQEIFPGLIKKWHYDFKNNKYILTLGSDKFHNGREINSFDLEFSLIRGFISDFENYNKIHFSDIAGVEDLKVGMKYKTGMVSGIKVIDQKTIEISLKNVNPIFLINFTVPFVPLVPKEELKDDLYTWKSHPIGAGPYKIESDYKDNVLTLSSVSQLSAGFPSKIEYHTARKLEKYDVIFDRVVATDAEKKFSRVFSKYPAAINSIFFYRDNKFVENINFRKAIYHAIDRDAVAEGGELFKPAYEMLVRPYGGKVEIKNPYNLELAKEYVKKLPKEFFEKEFIVGVYSVSHAFTPVMIDRVKIMSEQLSKLGLKIKFEPNIEKFPTPEVMKKYSMKLWSKVVDLADPAVSFGAMSSFSPYKNEMPDSNGEYDRLYVRATQANTFEGRLKGIQDIANLIEEEALIVPIMQRYVMYRFDPSTVESLGDQARPLFMDISLVRMK